MPDYTDEEYDALDEYYTKNPPRVSGDGKSGFFAKHKGQSPGHVIIVDDLSADWLRIKAVAEHTTPEAIIGQLVRKEIARTA
ncbi:MAG: hypothetical protein LBT00_15265 [Spirochaetaceae bacterium]|jgi:hypothetical protein|nr:hypothetical protein [Spirochaetaceae bacterium]